MPIILKINIENESVKHFVLPPRKSLYQTSRKINIQEKQALIKDRSEIIIRLGLK